MTPTTPPSGQAPVVVEQPVQPAAAPPSAARISVSGIRITGNTVFSETELRVLIASALTPGKDGDVGTGTAGVPGKQLSFAELQALADRITAHYREHGYLLAHAYLPAQDVLQGQIEIAVLEGRVSRVNWTNESRHTDSTLKDRLATLPLDTPLYNPTLERSLLLLSDLPGSEVQATLKPGASIGTSDLDIQVKDRGLFSGDVSLDNQGSRFTGEYRLGAGLNLNSPLHLGDILDLRMIGAGRGFSYGRLAWQVPLGRNGLRVGVAGSSMNYRLQKDFAALQAHGTARIGSVYALYPVIRSRFTNVSAQLAYDHKKLDDRADSTASIATKTLDVWQAGLSGSRYDSFGGGGLNSWALIAVSGTLNLDPAARITDAAALRTQGHHSKVSMQLARMQQLPDGWNLYGQISGQAAQKNLDSAEKFSLGGSQAVRAYPQGEAPVDDGWLATLELRYIPTSRWQVSVFHDAAEGRLQHAPVGGTGNQRRLSGSGLGLIYAPADGLSLQATLSWRTGDTPTSDNDRHPRGWLRLQQIF